MASTVTDPMIGRLVDGRYQVEARVARGGMATVYRAQDRRLDRVVALKVMHPHLADGTDVEARFRREARAAARLTHPGVVGVYDQGTEDETSYLTMEYVDGENLRRRLRREGCLDLGDAIDVMDPILDALAAAHRAGLVHRDMKPENVLLARDGAVKVADFGLARAVTEATAASTGTLLGTVAYLSPEIVTSGNADARADVYAAGIMFYELLTGHPPFEGDSPIQIAYRHVHEDVPPASDEIPWLPDEVDEFIASLTAREPAGRPADAGAALARLRAVRAGLEPQQFALRGRVDVDEVDHIVAEVTDELADGGTIRVREGGTVALPIGAVAAPSAAALEPARTGDTPVRRRRRRRRITLAVVLVLLLGVLGAGAWWYQTIGPGAYTAVPPVGADPAAAEASLTEAGLRPVPGQDHDDTVPEGEVLRTEPAAGQRIKKDGEVTLVVSQGVRMFVMPAVEGTRFADLDGALKAAGWDGTLSIEREFNADYAEGEIIATDQSANAQVAHNSPISVRVSKGREPVTVPDLTNRTLEEARAEAERAGMTIADTPAEAFSDTVPKGSIIEQAPTAASSAYRGDSVQLTVSKGPELIEVPKVTGKQYDEAKQTLESLGFVVKKDAPIGNLFNTVHGQDPKPGKKAPFGSTITLTVV